LISIFREQEMLSKKLAASIGNSWESYKRPGRQLSQLERSRSETKFRGSHLLMKLKHPLKITSRLSRLPVELAFGHVRQPQGSGDN
jgi:hypothetical protein